jgi:hypothetical protein
MPPLGPAVPTVAATDRYVYVLRGNQLYSFDAKTLREVAKVTLEAPPGPPRPADAPPGGPPRPERARGER